MDPHVVAGEFQVVLFGCSVDNLNRREHSGWCGCPVGATPEYRRVINSEVGSRIEHRNDSLSLVHALVQW